MPVAWLLLYLLAGVWLLPLFRYTLSPDTVSMIAIARQYLAGEFGAAVNGYWNPLLSWLLVPLLAAGLPALLSVKLVLLGSGAIAWWGMRRMLGALEVHPTIRLGIETALLPVLLAMALKSNTADLLGTSLLLIYLSMLLDPRYGTRRWDGAVCGLFGELAFLAKTYHLPFFLAHFTITTLMLALRGEMRPRRRAVIRHYLLGLLALALTSGWWIGAISHKYGSLTVGTSGRYNFALVNPVSRWHPIFYLGLLPPSTPHGISAWDDPSYFRLALWHPWDTASTWNYTRNLVSQNLRYTVNILLAVSPFALMILFLALYHARQRVVGPLLMAVVCGSVGYLMIAPYERYLYLVALLLLALAGIGLSALRQCHPLFAAVAAVLVLGTFALPPMRYLASHIADARHGIVEGKPLADAGATLRHYSDGNMRLASNCEWTHSLTVAYFAGCPYYGCQAPDETDATFKDELTRYRITHLLTWDTRPTTVPAGSVPVPGTYPGFRVYRLPNVPPPGR